MSEAFLYPLILAILTGAAYIAYKHPEAYAEFYRSIARIWLLLAVFAAGFIIGGNAGPVAGESVVSLTGWFLAAFGVATFLRMLGPWLKISDNQADRGDGEK